MKIYISGKITNNPNYKQEFAKAKKELTSQGNVVMNPAELPEGLDYEQYMHIGFAMIDISDAVYMLSNSKGSSGAFREMMYAEAMRKETIFEKE